MLQQRRRANSGCSYLFLSQTNQCVLEFNIDPLQRSTQLRVLNTVKALLIPRIGGLSWQLGEVGVVFKRRSCGRLPPAAPGAMAQAGMLDV